MEAYSPEMDFYPVVVIIRSDFASETFSLTPLPSRLGLDCLSVRSFLRRTVKKVDLSPKTEIADNNTKLHGHSLLKGDLCK
jgi:hypothetical protein